jgi:hypothetical protein
MRAALGSVLLPLLLGEGAPLFYWGARAPVIAVEQATREGVEAHVQEVHAALDKGALVVRLTFDRAVREATQSPEGSPVSGRLRATLYVDGDGDRATGLAEGPADPRTGADLRLEVGVIAMGEDAEEKRAASALIAVHLAALQPNGRRRTLWRTDDASSPKQVSARGEWLELRLPPEAGVKEKARLVLSLPDRTLDGRLR